MIEVSLIGDTGWDLDLDFHAIMHWGDDVALQAEALHAPPPAGSGRFTSILTVKAEVHGDRALISYTYPIKALNQTAEPWIRESGEWRRNWC